MTASTLSHLPLQAGSALATGAGRAILWAIARYARAPLANTSILALTVFTAMAGSNALYFQVHHHPSPLFGPAPDYEVGVPDTVTPATRKTAVTLPPIVVIDETTASVKRPVPQPVTEPIGNAAVIAMQRKLTTLGLYDGKVDGVFGPKTSGAIRRFEEKAGFAPRGELTEEILDAIARAPIVLPQATGTPPRPLAVVPLQPAAQPQIIVVQPQTIAPPATVASNDITGSIPPANIGNPAAPEDSFQPLPTPEPLALSLEAATTPRPLIPRRDLPDSPREVLNLAVATAKNGIQALASVLENGPQLGPTNSAAAQVAPIPATQSVQPQPAPIVQASIQQPMPAMPAATIAPPATIAPAPTPIIVVEAAPVITESIPVVTEPAPIVVADTPPVVVITAPPEATSERELISQVQRGLSSLGFLRGEVDGVVGEATAKAIRNFEVYYNYDVTGRVTPELVDLLVAAGAQI